MKMADARAGAYAAVLAALAVGLATAGAASAPPSILDLFSRSTRTQLENGRPVIEIVSEPDVDLAIVAAVRSRIDADVFLTRFREVERLLQGRYTAMNGRFSSPPRLEDLSPLTLDDDDLDDLRDCRPGRCGLKLSSTEIGAIRAAVDGAGNRWQAAALEAFKQALVDRAAAFRRKGLSGLVPYEDDGEAVHPAAVTRQQLDVVERRGVVRLQALASLRTYPDEIKRPESLLFWSKDTLGDTKPIVTITHAAIWPGDEQHQPLVMMTQVYASHYLDASVSVTTLVPGTAGQTYLAYLRLSNVDVFDGSFGGFIRRMVQRRLKSDGPRAIDALRRRLEAPAG